MVEDSQNRTATLLFGGLIGFVGGLVVAGVLAIWIYNATPFRAETTPHAKLEPIKPKVEPKADARASTKTEAERKADAERIVPPGPPGSAGVPAKAVVRDEPPKKDTEPAPSAEPRGRLWLQVGAYANRQEAENQRARFAMLGYEAQVQSADIPDKGQVHRVRVGPYRDPDEAGKVRGDLARQGIEVTVVKP